MNDRLADARSILAILILAANFGTVMDLEVNGVDEADAHAAISELFDSFDDGDGVIVTDSARKKP